MNLRASEEPETFPLKDILDGISKDASDKLTQEVEIDEKSKDFAITKDEDLPIGPRWFKIGEAYVVFADIQSSSQFGKHKVSKQLGNLYDSAMWLVTETLHQFGVDYVDIQGDAAFGVFWSSNAKERAICAAITINTLSFKWAVKVKTEWREDCPDTGFKIGVAANQLLMKRVGISGKLNKQAVVFAGKPVNYASKASDVAEAHQIVVTKQMWTEIEENGWITHSCGCVDKRSDGEPVALWENIEIPNVNDANNNGMLLTANWCETHGEIFCQNILNKVSRKL